MVVAKRTMARCDKEGIIKAWMVEIMKGGSYYNAVNVKGGEMARDHLLRHEVSGALYDVRGVDVIVEGDGIVALLDL